MFAAGGKKGKGADKEGAGRFKKDIITYKNQALQPVSRSASKNALNVAPDAAPVAKNAACHLVENVCFRSLRFALDLGEGLKDACRFSVLPACVRCGPTIDPSTPRKQTNGTGNTRRRTA